MKKHSMMLNLAAIGGLRQAGCAAVAAVVTAFLFLACLTASANPSVFPLGSKAKLIGFVRMSAENLVVAVSPTNASFSGTFAFRWEWQSSQNWRLISYQADLTIPIWLPDRSSGDASIAAFWRSFEKDPDAAKTRRAFEKLTGLRVSVEGRRVRPKGVRANGPLHHREARTSPWDAKRRMPEVPEEPGFRCVLVDFTFPLDRPSASSQAQIRATASYQHPLSGPGGDARFFYVPFPINQPLLTGTVSANQHAITMTASVGCFLDGKNGDQEFTVPPGRRVTLAPLTTSQSAQLLDHAPTPLLERRLG